MSASKRDFTEFDKFPGSLDEGTGFHIFPKLWHKDELDRWREWQIFVRLVKCDKQLSGIDWELLTENQIVIKPEYYEMGVKINSSICAEAWVENGIEGMKITRSSPTYFSEPKNEGKLNERNVFQQGLIYARSLWLKRKDKGNIEKKSTKKQSSQTNVMYFPMLAKTFKDGEKYITFPCYIQPKLDGVRCLAFLKKKDGGEENVIIYTRTKKLFPSVEYLKKILYFYLNELYDEKNNQSIYLDGELYKHGKKLQDISGDSRNERYNEKSKSRNEYHIYDCFYPNELYKTFKERYSQLLALYENLSKKDSQYIKTVPTIEIASMKEATHNYQAFVKKGYEGAIIRNFDGEYLANSEKTGSFMRSKNLIKMKPVFTDEFELVGYTDGKKGKDRGAVIWICQTKEGHEFNVSLKDVDYEERYRLYKDCEANFKKKYSNRMMTVQYEDLSKNNIPQRAKALGFRDYE